MDPYQEMERQIFELIKESNELGLKGLKVRDIVCDFSLAGDCFFKKFRLVVEKRENSDK